MVSSENNLHFPCGDLIRSREKLGRKSNNCHYHERGIFIRVFWVAPELPFCDLGKWKEEQKKHEADIVATL